MSSTVDNPPPASQHFVNAVLGTVIVGWQVQLILWGVGIAKLHQYVNTRAFHADPRWLKALLWTAALACTVQAGISFYSIWHYSTWQQRDEDTLYSQTIPDCFATAPVGVVGVLVQGYLIYRASVLLRNQLLRAAYLVFMWCSVGVAFSGAMMYIAVSFMYRAGKPFPPGLNFGTAVGTWLWASAFVDVMITASLAFVLRSRIMNFNASTDSLLRRLIRLAVQTACYTAVLAVCGAALAFSFSADSDQSIYTNAAGSFYQPLSSCYLISLIVTLSFRNKALEQEHTQVPVISTAQLHGFANSQSIMTNPSRIGGSNIVNGFGSGGAGGGASSFLSASEMENKRAGGVGSGGDKLNHGRATSHIEDGSPTSLAGSHSSTSERQADDVVEVGNRDQQSQRQSFDLV
ncbi:hypothetical protein ACM66B_004860 [Microbotryomycetes sp. NB124-2]